MAPVKPSAQVDHQPDFQPPGCLTIALLRKEVSETAQVRSQGSLLELAERAWRGEPGFEWAHNKNLG